MKTPHFLQQYSFTRSERLALVIIAVLSIFFCILPGLYRLYKAKSSTKQPIDTAWMELIKEEKQAPDKRKYRHSGFNEEKEKEARPVELFAFDPNTASLEELRQLGLKAWLAQRIINYRNKGGKFRHKEDLKKIYGLAQSDYNRLEPWIKIEEPKGISKRTEKYVSAGHTDFGTDSPDSLKTKQPAYKPYQKRARERPLIDINQASVEDWQSLRGIGPAYSKRIVNFRNKLGGFYSVEQVGETYGLPDTVFQMIKPYLKASPILKPIDLNNADINTLTQHPYITYNQAKALYYYVQQHAPVMDPEQLRNAMLEIFTKEKWEKLEPYLDLRY